MADFTILASNGLNGTLSPVGDVIVAAGEDVTFTISPSAGYVPLVTVDAALMGSIYAYVFPDVAADHSISVVFNPVSFNIDQFRLDFPEFASTTKYTDAMITFWGTVGDLQLNANRWGSLRLYGLQLFVAHNVTLQAMDVASAAIPGGAPGTATGLISNQNAGSVSVGIDTQASIEDAGGNYNLTSYGRSFLRMARMMGIGGLQL